MMNKWSVWCVVILFGCVFALGRLYRQEYKEKRRLEANQEVLFSKAEFYRTKDSLSAAGVERLMLSNKEFSRYCHELEQTVAGLQIKNKRLQSVSRTATESLYPVHTIVKDSVVPGRRDTLQCMDFENAYLSFSGCLEQGEFRGQVLCRDTLIQVVHRVPRKFWFIRWGTKAIRQEIVARNPYSRIVYTEYIEFKK